MLFGLGRMALGYALFRIPARSPERASRVKRTERQESIRAMNVMRFVVLGAVGFGLGAALAPLLLGPVALPVALLIGGAVGGASLRLAFEDRRRVVILALLGSLGLTVGVTAGLILGPFFSYSEVPITVIVGAAVGASLGAAFPNLRTMLVLAVAGAVGFSVGLSAGDFLRFSFPKIRPVGEIGSITVAGLVGGASLGVALGYLETRKLAEERGPRVR